MCIFLPCVLLKKNIYAHDGIYESSCFFVSKTKVKCAANAPGIQLVISWTSLTLPGSLFSFLIKANLCLLTCVSSSYLNAASIWRGRQKPTCSIQNWRRCGFRYSSDFDTRLILRQGLTKWRHGNVQLLIPLAVTLPFSHRGEGCIKQQIYNERLSKLYFVRESNYLYLLSVTIY